MEEYSSRMCAIAGVMFRSLIVYYYRAENESIIIRDGRFIKETHQNGQASSYFLSESIQSSDTN